MTTIDVHHDSEPDVDSRGAIAVDGESGTADDAKGLMAKARYDAFKLMTEARDEAESILEAARSEAADIVKEAKLTGESIVDAARLRAGGVLAAEPDDKNTAKAELEAEHAQLTERVSSLRTLATALEERFEALAASAAQSPPRLEEPARPVIDYSPAVAPPQKVQRGAEAPNPTTEEKGSFYNRRSAKLPRIGEAGGRSALDMMKSIRETIED